ncbi:hypothetical protein FVE85_6063 [Porphyridium purpureum]|uniref:PDZ domain-containing protein n=1 Tax=Porphyridium purpureum TaxID=35688 RepID=A0A5J4Z5I6_PORPP|nr:hypothetical protein FVE85_6063 [Porphyridium purpureum]|eukprot:POR4120..scf295_1
MRKPCYRADDTFGLEPVASPSPPRPCPSPWVATPLSNMFVSSGFISRQQRARGEVRCSRFPPATSGCHARTAVRMNDARRGKDEEVNRALVPDGMSAEALEAALPKHKERNEPSRLLEGQEGPDGKPASRLVKLARPLGLIVEATADDIVYVEEVVEGGNAEKAGIKVGDILVGASRPIGFGMIPLKSTRSDSALGLFSDLVRYRSESEPIFLEIRSDGPGRDVLNGQHRTGAQEKTYDEMAAISKAIHETPFLVSEGEDEE